MKIRDIFKIASIPIVLASLCCLSSVVIVLFGIGSVTLASSLADTLYGEYKWLFRAFGFLALAIGIVVYLRRQKGICTIDEAKRRRQEIINIVLVSLVAAVAGYFIFLYIVVHYAGVFLGLWS